MICTVAGDGGSNGAVYTPPAEIVPQDAPAQPVPATLQEITRLGLEPAAGVSAAAYVAVLPALTDDGPMTASENKLVTVIVPLPLLDGSATLIAVNETLGAAVRTCGAVYIPEESTLPHAFPGQTLPEITQVTARSGLPAEFTVAVKWREEPRSTCIVCGETETEMPLAIATSAVDFLELSAALVACTDTEAGEGRFAGAV